MEESAGCDKTRWTLTVLGVRSPGGFIPRREPNKMRDSLRKFLDECHVRFQTLTLLVHDRLSKMA
jgi:hypothetical protein